MRLILAAVTPDNTPHGYNLTFAFPMLLFIIIGGILYLLFSRPHRRIPARTISLSPSRPAGSTVTASSATATSATSATAPSEPAAPAAESQAEVPADEAAADEAAADEAAGTETTEGSEGSE
ncbi:MAG TPA: hypothetical protein VK823_25865 [Streptosporangiaceae bacterium]|nr:hypothetical protein [Streptosporangiaceae bacterium]